MGCDLAYRSSDWEQPNAPRRSRSLQKNHNQAIFSNSNGLRIACAVYAITGNQQIVCGT
jgi:hypothetical protein